LRHDIDDLIQALADTSVGSELSIGDILVISWSTPDPVIDKAARDAWVRLQHFSFDADTRARDPEYDKRLRAEMKWRKDELSQLVSGSDPYGRRSRFLSRLWRSLRHWAQLAMKQ
jgi:hypothetical protein